jgi:hypothetical protein
MQPGMQRRIEILTGAGFADRAPLRMNSGIDSSVIEAISS